MDCFIDVGNIRICAFDKEVPLFLNKCELITRIIYRGFNPKELNLVNEIMYKFKVQGVVLTPEAKEKVSKILSKAAVLWRSYYEHRAGVLIGL